MEILYASVLLWKADLVSGELSNNYLDSAFIKDSSNNLLLELETCSSSCEQVFNILQNYFQYYCKFLDENAFEKELFSQLKSIYTTTDLTTEQIAEKCYSIWLDLPEQIKLQQPYYSLNTVNDCFSFGDEELSKEMFKDMFNS